MKYENTYMSYLVDRLQEAIENDDMANIVKYADRIKTNANCIVGNTEYEEIL